MESPTRMDNSEILPFCCPNADGASNAQAGARLALKLLPLVVGVWRHDNTE